MNEYFKDKNIFTLNYNDKNKEDEFLLSIQQIRKTQMLYLSGITMFFYILYIGVDLSILPDKQFFYAFSLHCLIAFFLLSSILLLLSNKFTHLAIPVLKLSVIIASIGSLALTKVGIDYYIIEIYVILVWVFSLIGFKFVEALVLNIVNIVLQIVFLSVYKTMSYEEVVIHLFMISAAFCMGLIGGYIIELYARINFENKMKILDMKENLKEQASKDYLTNLYNRRYFHEFIEGMLPIIKRKKEHFCVIMIDIDKFKNINDTYGHSVGDEVIKLLAFLLAKYTRDSDVVSRYGGEEFALFFPFTDKNGAVKIAEELRIAVENQNIHIGNDNYIQFTISLGIDYMNEESEMDMSKSLMRADKALYKAKKNGRNRVEIY